MKKLIIVGCGGFARELYWHAQDSLGYLETWELKGFLDGDVRLPEAEYEKLELPVVGDIASYEIQPDDVFVCAVGTPAVRKKMSEALRARGGKFFTLMHKTAIVHGTAQIGEGTILCPRVSIHDHAVIGKDVLFNGNSGAGHDVTVGDHSCFMGGCSLCGYAQIGRETYWGDGACALPHSRVDDGAFVGARSVVFKHVRAGQKVFGNPAMPI